MRSQIGRSVRVLLLGVVSTTLLAAACASDSGGDAVEAAGPDPSSAEDLAAEVVDDQNIWVSLALRPTTWPPDLSARAPAVESCMAKQGFADYVYVPAGVFAEEAPGSLAYTARYGFGITTFGTTPPDRPDDNDAQRDALNGREGRAGCLQVVTIESSTADSLRASALSTATRPLSAEFEETVQAEPAVVALIEAWPGCMEERGYSYRTFEDISGEINARHSAAKTAAGDGGAAETVEDVQAFELAVALDLFECGGGEVAQLITNGRKALVAEWAADHLAELDAEFSTQQTDLCNRAEQASSDLGFPVAVDPSIDC